MDAVVYRLYQETLGFRLRKPEWIEYLNNLTNKERKEVIIRIFKYGDQFVLNILSFFKDWWINFGLDEWKGILNYQQGLSDITVVLSFLYKYVEVDALGFFVDNSTIGKSQKKQMLKYIRDYPGIFEKDYQSEISFPLAKQILMGEGLPEATYERKFISRRARKLKRSLCYLYNILMTKK